MSKLNLREKVEGKRILPPPTQINSLFSSGLKKGFIAVGCCAFSMNVWAQSNQRVTLHLKNATLEQVIWEIQKQSKVVIMYGTTDIQAVKNISLEEKDKPIKYILDKCLKNTGLTYEITGNEIIIKQEPTQKSRTIKGTVIDKDGIPLPGVSVRLKDTTIGTTTNADGEYTIKISGKYPTLVYSFIGMETKETPVRSSDQINVTLNENTKTLKRNTNDEITDISVLGTVVPFKMYKPNEKKVTNTVEKINMRLRTYTGGYLRFEGDHYRGGNSPWAISTLWMAMYYKEIGESKKAKECIDFIVNSSNEHGLLGEQIDNSTMQPNWVIGLAWSHAMFILALL